MEIWKDIKDYEGMYQVSSCGRVKSLERLANNNQLIKERILKPYIIKRKNPTTVISLSNCGKYKRVSLSRLVYETFIHEVDNEHYVIPIDNNFLNSKVENLMSCSIQDVRRKMKPHEGSSSVFKGVFKRKCSKKWFSCPHVNGVSMSLGSFDTEIEAALAYDEYITKNYNGLYETNESLGLYGIYWR